MIEDTGELLGTADEHRAYATLHPGAVYLHLGEQFLVQELDLVSRVAVVRPADPDFYTQARDVTDIAVAAILARSSIGDVQQCFGSVRVTNQVVSYVRRSVSTNETLEEFPLPLPPVELETRAVWWTIPTAVLDRAGVGRARRAGRDPRRRARCDRAAAARRHVRPMGHRRRLDADAPRHRPHDDLHLRRRTPAGPASPSGAPRRANDGCAPRSRRSGSAPARTDARAACTARSAATATSRSTSRAPWPCSRRSSGSAGARRRPSSPTCALHHRRGTAGRPGRRAADGGSADAAGAVGSSSPCIRADSPAVSS